ncbi:MAG: DUF4838 domain-containing protein [Candidatus Hydrogenedentes bacterium]|nr:DUF4838 domain-containing protein [Candidatus Hydrogenedentota bacterium]
MFKGLLVGAVLAVAMGASPEVTDNAGRLDPLQRAARHPLEINRPCPDFFDGALLGNGGLGAVVTTRPDAIVVHFGHNNVWDIRIAEDNKEKIGTFREVFDKVAAIPADLPSLESDPWYAAYRDMTHANYRKPYPRPYPCGSLLLGFDRRKVELLGHRLDIATGLCVVRLLVNQTPAELRIFVEMAKDRLWVELTDANGNPIANCFDRVRLMPDPDAPSTIPSYEVLNAPTNSLSFRQVLPRNEPVEEQPGEPDPRDRAFRLSVRVNGAIEPKARLNWEGLEQEMGPLERGFVSAEPFVAVVQIDEGLAATIGAEVPELPQPESRLFDEALNETKALWESYWTRSGVALGDEFLERIWYWNHYFFNCAAKAGVNCPGLFANWSYRNIGTAWHGDYHMNYNTQQPFWLPFSSNRVEKNLPYVELVEHLLPLSRKWAQEYYGLRGAYFPHSAYPVEMSMSPYPVPTWGWEICETPWAVQGLWWHYLYTMDKEFLRDRAFVPIRDAVLFLVDYMKRPEARGERWNDDRYHIFPTVPPELYGLKPGFKYNYDCLVDLTLTKFVMKAYLESTRVLGVEDSEADLIVDVREILDHFPEYPTAESGYGKVFVSVPGEHAEVVYNTPNSLMTVFPGEDHGLHSPSDISEILRNTYRNTQNEGGNDLVFMNLQAARIGMLDLERFKRQIEYCMLPNGTCTNMVLQVHGRYNDTTPFDFMAPMGIWFENFSLPVVINECLMQSYDGTIQLFPNWPKDKPAAFRTLRAAGAFLVSATCSEGRVNEVEILSEAGSTLRLHIPWEGGAHLITASGERDVPDALLELATITGETIRLLPRSGTAHNAAAAQVFVKDAGGSSAPLERIHVAPGSPDAVRFAASELQEYLRKAAGVDLTIAEGLPERCAFFVSTSQAATDAPAGVVNLGEGGFDRSAITVHDGCVYLIGENPRSVVYAVYDFLQSCLGIRFFGPGEQHEFVPARDALALDEGFQLRKGSAFEFRDYYLPNPANEDTVDFLVKNRVNTFCIVATLDQAPPAIRQRGGLIHGPGHIFKEFLPQETLFSEHPEYFPMTDGKRAVTGNGACFSSPEVRRIFQERLRDYVRAHPYWDIFALWAEDVAYAAYCECEECAKMSTAGWYMTLVNEAAPVVEQELPQALFEFIAYHETRWPPKEVIPLYKNGKNMILNLCLGYSRNGFHSLATRKDGNAEVLDMYDAWKKRLDEVGFEGRRILFDYYNRCEITAGHGPSGQSLIWPMEVIAEDTKYYLADGIRGLGDWVCFSRLCWPTPFNVWCWLQWYSTPDRPLSELEEEFYPAYFGEAGPAVREYMHALQRSMYADTSRENIEQVAGLRAQLDVLVNAQQDPVLKHRLEVVRNHHEYCVMLKRIFLAFMESDEQAWSGMMKEYVDFYPVTHKELLKDEIDIPSQFMNLWYEYHLKRPPEQIPEVLKALVSYPSSR